MQNPLKFSLLFLTFYEQNLYKPTLNDCILLKNLLKVLETPYFTQCFKQQVLKFSTIVQKTTPFIKSSAKRTLKPKI